MSQTHPEPPSEWLNVPELARELGLGQTKILGWIRRGELRAYNLASHTNGERARWLIRRADFEAFLASRAATPPPPPTRRRKRDDVPQYV